MMYPFIQLDDKTEIVHSELLENEKVKVYIEKPIDGGFNSAMCYLPEYKWDEITGFSDDEIREYHKMLESMAHLIIRFAKEGGFDNAANF
ncbi:MAG: hypothetical protein FWH14_05830 [Oscillospiraceae bacterium]|nr:hypothetical protein [Oscillospiraceae bacterium]